jgi:oligosaccharide repeat unit polymerase
LVIGSNDFDSKHVLARSPVSLAALILGIILFVFFDISVLPAILYFMLCLLYCFGDLWYDCKAYGRSVVTIPLTWLYISFLVIFGLSPLYRSYSGNILPNVFSNFSWINHLGDSVILGGIAVMSANLGRLASFHNGLERDLTLKFNSKRNHLAIIVSIFLVFIFLIAYFRWALSYGISSAFFGNRQIRQLTGAISQNGYIVEAPLIVASALSFWHFRALKLNMKGRLLLLCILFLMIPSFAQGDRSKIFFYTISILILRLWAGKPMRRFTIIVSLIFVPFLIFAMREWRIGNSLSGRSLSSIFEQMVETLLLGEDTAMAPLMSALINRIGEDLNYFYGSSYLTVFARPVPSVIWPTKPPEIDKILNLEFFPSLSNSVGFSFSGLSEPYVNFGILGVVLFYFLLGFLSHKMYLRATFGDVRFQFFSAWLCAFMIILARGNFSTDFQRLAIPILIGWVLFKLVLDKASNLERIKKV